MFMDRESSDIPVRRSEERDSPCKGEMFIDRETGHPCPPFGGAGLTREVSSQVPSAPPNGGNLCVGVLGL